MLSEQLNSLSNKAIEPSFTHDINLPAKKLKLLKTRTHYRNLIANAFKIFHRLQHGFAKNNLKIGKLLKR